MGLGENCEEEADEVSEGGWVESGVMAMGVAGTEPVLPVSKGVGGIELDGLGASTIHMRWERVATSLATACASVFIALTWKTGNESLPSLTPRSERITLIKWMQDEDRSGREVVFVRSRTST